LALMQPEDVEALFNSEDIAKLARAKALKSGIVYQDCIELVQGFFALRDICETGNYKSQGKKGNAVKMERRRKTMVPGMRPKAGSDSPDEEERGKENEAPIDSDDGFHDVMKAFVDTNLAEARNIAKGCFSVFKVFKELALFFDDVSSLWPPPVDEKGPKIDLIAVFHSLSEQVRVHREEIEQDGFRALVQPPEPDPPPPDEFDGIAEALPSSSGAVATKASQPDLSDVASCRHCQRCRLEWKVPDPKDGRCTKCGEFVASGRLDVACGARAAVVLGYRLPEGLTLTKHDGYIYEGGDLLKETMTVDEAMRKTMEIPGCIGFTHKGASGSSPVTIWFKSKWNLKVDKHEQWTSYKKEAMAQPPLEARGDGPRAFRGEHQLRRH